MVNYKDIGKRTSVFYTILDFKYILGVSTLLKIKAYSPLYKGLNKKKLLIY